MKEFIVDLSLWIGAIAMIGIIGLAIIAVCLVIQRAFYHVRNAKHEVHLYIEFLQWKANKACETKKKATDEDKNTHG